jgi:hypothetical protein
MVTMCNEPPFGSQEWADDIFSRGPVRDPSGRSKKTQRFAPKFDGVLAWSEGGNEVLAMYVLEYFKLRGVVLRWKWQPFTWHLPDGSTSKPDFVAELFDRLLLVIQVKAEKFRTPVVQARFDVERQAAAAAGVRHLIWTDKHPLTAGAKSVFFRIRGARNTPHQPEDRAALVDAVRKHGRTTAGELAAAGYDPALIPAAVRNGDVFISLEEPIYEQTVVSSTPLVDGRGFLLGSGFDAQSWWNSLPRR